MAEALTEAIKGMGKTSPNPSVGAVIVKHGKIIDRGYHKKAGSPHAEAIALKKAGKAAKGATIYITLEPCNHHGKTPPCAFDIIASGIKRVVIGTKDTNKKVSGGGAVALEKAGIEVTTGVLAKECRGVNEWYFKYNETGLPFVTLKMALSLDGRIATKTGDSRWISGVEARKFAHGLRSINDAVLVGIGTVTKDDPRLNVRQIKGVSPVKVLIDTELKVSAKASIFKGRERVVVLTAKKSTVKKAKVLMNKGAELVTIKRTKGGISLREAIKKLGTLGIRSVMVEGGSKVAAGMLKAKLVNKAYFVISPKLIGGDGIPVVGALGIKKISSAIELKQTEAYIMGSDIIIEGYIG